MATDPSDERPPLTAEDLDRIRARMTARANLGVAPGTPPFMDAGGGSIFGDLEGPGALELDEFYDFAELVARATIPTDSFGEWLDDWAESLGLERKDEAPAGGVLRFTGTPGTLIEPGQEVTTVAPVDADPIAFQVVDGGEIPGTGTLDTQALAVEPGSSGNVPAGTVTVPGSEIDGVTAITNPARMTAGADIESDELLNDRVRIALSGDVGSGTSADYVRWLLSRPGIGHVTVRPIARGPGTVDIYVTDLNNDPIPALLLAETQTWLDPVAGQGLGQAPIGHDARVLTPATTNVTVEAQIIHKTGYTLDGTGGTIATRATIQAAVGRYIDGLDVGADPILNVTGAAIIDASKGVLNYAGLKLNGVAADLAIAADHVATTVAVTLTE